MQHASGTPLRAAAVRTLDFTPRLMTYAEQPHSRVHEGCTAVNAHQQKLHVAQ